MQEINDYNQNEKLEFLTFLNEIKSVSYIQKGPLSTLDQFLSISEKGADFYTFIDILNLRHAVQKNMPSLAHQNKSFVPPFFSDHILFVKKGEKIYRFYLDQENPHFYTITPEKRYQSFYKEILAVFDYILTVPTAKKYQKIIKTLYGRRTKTLDKSNLKNSLFLPAFTQIVEKHLLEKQLNPNIKDEIAPTFCSGHRICGLDAGKYWMIIPDGKKPRAIVFENNTIRYMSLEEFKKLYKMFAADRNLYLKVYRMTNLAETKEILLKTLPEEIKAKSNQTVKLVQKRDTLSCEIVNVPESLITKPQQPVSLAFFEELMDQKELDLSKIYALWQDKSPKTPDCLKGLTLPFQALLLPEEAPRIPYNNGFITPFSSRPHFKYLYATLVLQAQINQLRKNKPLKDTPSFDIPPVLCNDNALYYKKGSKITRLFFDDEYPDFRTTDLNSKTVSYTDWQTISSIINEWLGDDKKTAKTLLERLAPLYSISQNKKIAKKMPQTHPTFEDIFARAYYQALFDAVSQNKTDSNKLVEPLNIIPLITAGNEILNIQGDTTYKISVSKQGISFEKHQNRQKLLMSPFEAQVFMHRLGQTVPSDVCHLFLKVYNATHAPVFEDQKRTKISLEERDAFLKNQLNSLAIYKKMLRLKRQRS